MVGLLLTCLGGLQVRSEVGRRMFPERLLEVSSRGERGGSNAKGSRGTDPASVFCTNHPPRW